MKSFRELTRRGRLHRLRQLAREALHAYNLNAAHLGFIQYNENIIYRVDAPGPTTSNLKSSPYLPDRFLLRIHAMGNLQAINSELTWLKVLNQEAGLAVPAPVPASDGKLVTTIVTPGIPHGRVVSLMKWLDGRKYLQGFRPHHLEALGHVVAQMHAFSASWQPPAGFDRPHWDWASQLGGSMFRHPLEQVIDSIPAIFKQPFQVISAEAKQVMESFGKGRDAYGLIHADLYPENVLFKAGKALPIDFEDCGYGYWLWDIAIALNEWAWGEEWERMRDAFYEGYAQFHTLPEAQWAKLDFFIAIQFATMVLWSSALLMNDPMRADEYEPWRNKLGNQLLNYFNR